MAGPIGGQDIGTTGTGGGLPQGQSETPNPVSGLGQGGGTLSQYYSGQGGLVAGTDTSGRGYVGQSGQQGESLANSQAAVRAGLVGSAGPVAPSGTVPPGPGQGSAASGAETLAQATGQTGTPPPVGAPAQATGVLGPNGSYGPPQGATQIGTQNGVPVFRGVDGTSMFTVDPTTGALTPFTGDANNAPGAPGPAPTAVGGPSLAQSVATAPAPAPAAAPAPAPAPAPTPAPAPAPTAGGPGQVFINGQWVSTGTGTTDALASGGGDAGSM
jgi:hypothetical protein